MIPGVKNVGTDHLNSSHLGLLLRYHSQGCGPPKGSPGLGKQDGALTGWQLISIGLLARASAWWSQDTQISYSPQIELHGLLM